MIAFNVILFGSIAIICVIDYCIEGWDKHSKLEDYT